MEVMMMSPKVEGVVWWAQPTYGKKVGLIPQKTFADWVYFFLLKGGTESARITEFPWICVCAPASSFGSEFFPGELCTSGAKVCV
jgi:hypothetical protein